MQRYKRGKAIQDHPLQEIFRRYEAKEETEFVKTFFGKEEANAILETCGIPPVDEYDAQPEYPVQMTQPTTLKS
jgi:hypothetical protein